MGKKVSELEGAELDYWAAKAQGFVKTRSEYDDRPELWDTGGGFYRVSGPAGQLGDERWAPSTNWWHGGPIIDRERISVWFHAEKGVWHAEVEANYKKGSGPTPLIAAMRAYVASKYGEEVPD